MTDIETLLRRLPAALYGNRGAESEVQGGALPLEFGVIYSFIPNSD